MAIRGNNALMVNPIFIPVSAYAEEGISPVRKKSSVTSSFPTMDEAWNAALSSWNAATWNYYPSYRIFFKHLVSAIRYRYSCSIEGMKAKLTVDLSAYNLNNYISAHLVVKPAAFPVYTLSEYYNEQGWIENEYNFLKDITGELGDIWVSTEFYTSAYTPSRPDTPPLGYYLTQSVKGWRAIDYWGYQGIYVALIPKT